MTSTLSVNDIEYLQSADVAQRFGYTKDYVSKLAREGVVVGKKVNRVWYVDPSSFEAFVKEQEANKQKRSADLRAERLVERKTHTVKEQLAFTPQSVASKHHAFLQSTAVVFCGVLLGVVGWVAQQENLNAHDLANGARSMATVIVAHTLPVSRDAHAISGIPAKMGAVASRQPLQKPVSTSSTSTLDFSDPVQVKFVTSGVADVQPVFRDGKTGQTYRVEIGTTSSSTKVNQ